MEEHVKYDTVGVQRSFAACITRSIIIAEVFTITETKFFGEFCNDFFFVFQNRKKNSKSTRITIKSRAYVKTKTHFKQKAYAFTPTGIA